jgi:hypothetical protein
MRKPQICKGGECDRMRSRLVQFGGRRAPNAKRSRMRGRVMPSIVRVKDRSREVAEGRLAPSPASLCHDARDPERDASDWRGRGART